MVADGIELAEYVRSSLGQEKLILMADSWGTVLATKMAARSPSLFHCYMGTSQLVNLQHSLSFGYDKTKKLAEKHQDSTTLEKLDALGKPPYRDGRTAGKLFRIIKKYERELSAPITEAFYKINPEFDSDEERKARMDGDDYSFFSLIGDQKLKISGMSEDIDLYEIGPNLKIPVHIFQGEFDLLCPNDINKPYFDSIKLDHKTFHLKKNTGHGITPEILEKQYQLLMENYHD